MTDTDIIDMYFARDQRAVEETQKRYGGYCYSIAQRMLDNKEDSEECVNDALLSVWNSIPPNKPQYLNTDVYWDSGKTLEETMCTYAGDIILHRTVRPVTKRRRVALQRRYLP